MLMFGSKFTSNTLSAAILVSLLFIMSTGVVSAQNAPVPPVWVGIYTTAGKVGLKWSPVKGAARYRVYKTIISGKGYEQVAVTTDVSYIDTAVKQGETYYYVLKSVNEEGEESAFSEERYIKVPQTGAGLPVEPPVWLGELVEKKRVRLAWIPSPSSNALAYNVYRSKGTQEDFRLIGSTQDSSFVDSDVSEGETYFYALTALDKQFKETGFGEVKKVVLRLPEEALPKRPSGPRGERVEETYVPPDKIIAKPTRVVGYITRGKDDNPLLSPTDIALGPEGAIYVADTGSSLIQVFNQSGEFVRAVGGFGSEDGKFTKLLGVEVDAQGNVFGVDAYSGKIQKFNPDGKLILRKNIVEDGKAIARDLGLDKPVKEFGVLKLLVADDGTIYAIDNFNCCIEVYSSNGVYIKTFGGKGLDDGQFQGPTFAAFGAGGDLYVVDCFNARVQVFDKDGTFLWKFGSYGNVVGTFSRPKGISIDDRGLIYVSDSLANVVQVFDEEGKFLYLLGDERGKQMDLGTPNGIVVDDRRRVYVVEKLVNRVQIRQVGD